MPAIVDSFERTYARRFGEGVGYPEGGVDLTALRLHVESAETLSAAAAVDAGAEATTAPAGSRSVYWPETRTVTETPVFDGPALGPGTRLAGPALVDYPDTTVVLRPDLHLRVERGGNLTIEMGT